MKQRRQADSNQFHYSVRGIQKAGMSGCVPRQIFEAEPESMLNRFYNGEWEHAGDKYGRAVINSDPAHWPLILNWLSFGAVPPRPSPAFIAECKYWQLTNLLDAIEQSAAAAGAQSMTVDLDGEHRFTVSRIIKDGRAGFWLAGVIHGFPARLDSDGAIHMEFQAYGQDWYMLVSKMGLYVQLMSPPPPKSYHVEIGFGPETSCYKATDADCDFDVDTEAADHDLYASMSGMLWSKAPTDDRLGLQEDELSALQKDPFVDLLGDLQIHVTLLFVRKAVS